LILCDKIGRNDVEENQHELRILYNKSLSVQDLLGLLIMKLLVDLKT
jgi:hypothetical protein